MATTASANRPQQERCTTHAAPAICRSGACHQPLLLWSQQERLARWDPLRSQQERLIVGAPPNVMGGGGVAVVG